jgi:NADH:ubiquinone oxidoreductase subunit
MPNPIALLFSWWKNPPLGTTLSLLWKGERVGADALGNRYYRERRARGRRARRWVLYAGDVEGSKVPSEWHAWLHGTTDDLPRADRRRHEWEKPHVPNLTGTAGAYRPSGSLNREGSRPAATGDYEPWRPA